MDISTLGALVQSFFRRGLAPSTDRTYSSAKKKYLEFCSQANLPAFPVTQNVACLFVAFLAHQGLQPQSISVYLSALGLRHLQITEGLITLPRSNWPQLQYILKGIKQSQAGTPTRVRLPITAVVMRQLKSIWQAANPDQRFEYTLLWAASCMAFFGFLRLGEVASDPSEPPIISVSSIAIDSHSNPSVIRIFLHRSKTDPFGQGAAIYLGRTNSDLCPVSALLDYLSIHPPPPKGPLFIHNDSSPLLHSQFVSWVKEALRAAGLNHSVYSGHSFRIGAATAAAQAGLPDHLKKSLGRWESEAYQSYICIPPELLASVSRSVW